MLSLLKTTPHTDARSKAPGFKPYTDRDWTVVERPRRGASEVGTIVGTPKKALPNPLTTSEQNKMIKKMLAEPKEMEYFRHSKADGNNCLPLAIDNMLQNRVVDIGEFNLIGETKIANLLKDANPVELAELGAKSFFDTTGNHDIHFAQWWAEDKYGKGSFNFIDITNKAEFMLRYVADKNCGVVWAGEQQMHTSAACVIISGRNFDLDGVSVTRIPRMITTCQDPYGDTAEDLQALAEEAYQELMNAKGKILYVFSLSITDEQLLAAKEKTALQAFCVDGTQQAESIGALAARGIGGKAKEAPADPDTVFVEPADVKVLAADVKVKGAKAKDKAKAKAEADKLAEQKKQSALQAKESQALAKRARLEAMIAQKAKSVLRASPPSDAGSPPSLPAPLAVPGSPPSDAESPPSLPAPPAVPGSPPSDAGSPPSLPAPPALPLVPAPANDVDDVQILGAQQQEPTKIYLADHGLVRWKAPGDGACLLWSAGVADGTMDASDFVYGADGSAKSPLLAFGASTEPLVENMRALRQKIVQFIDDSANANLLINEQEAVQTSNEYLDDGTWSRDAHIKGRQVLMGGDLASITIYSDSKGEYFLDTVPIFRQHGNNVQELASFQGEVAERLRAQRSGKFLGPKVHCVEYTGSHFNALIHEGEEVKIEAASFTGAASPDLVTHGFTIRGGQLTYAILCGAKRVENRHFQMKPGWYAVHTGAKTSSVESQQALLATVVGLPDESALPHSSIVGAVQVTHALTLEQCSPTEPWAFGPVVNVIGAVCRLARPVPHRGALSVWRISPETLGDVRAGLATAFVTPNDTTHLPPPSQTPKVFPNLRKPKAKAEEGGDVDAKEVQRPFY